MPRKFEDGNSREAIISSGNSTLELVALFSGVSYTKRKGKEETHNQKKQIVFVCRHEHVSYLSFVRFITPVNTYFLFFYLFKTEF